MRMRMRMHRLCTCTCVYACLLCACLGRVSLITMCARAAAVAAVHAAVHLSLVSLRLRFVSVHSRLASAHPPWQPSPPLKNSPALNISICTLSTSTCTLSITTVCPTPRELARRFPRRALPPHSDRLCSFSMFTLQVSLLACVPLFARLGAHSRFVLRCAYTT